MRKSRIIHCRLRVLYTLISIFTLIATSSIVKVQADLEITSDSDLGQSILQNARLLNGGGGGGGGGRDNNNNNNNNENNKVDYTWMARYSLKFLGCNNIQKWNTDANSNSNNNGNGNSGGGGKYIQTTKIVRFRLCPTNICKTNNHNGCGRGYGDYLVDIDTYVSAYVEAQRRQDEHNCEMYVYKHCNCQNTDDMDLCEYQCFVKKRKYECIENNPYYDDDSNTQGVYQSDLKDFEEYFDACSQFDPNGGDDDDGRRTKTRKRRKRQLEDYNDDVNNYDDAHYYDDANNYDAEEDEGQRSYYIGSYCSEQGGNVYLGVFTDDSCTNFADKNAGRSTYKRLTGGQDLPFSTTSMVRSECISCLEGANPQEQGDGNYGHISGNCKEIYQAAGKCETELSNSIRAPSVINRNACWFIEGLKIVRKDGILDTTFTRPNKVISIFIFIFAVSFVLMGAFIYYLRMSKFVFCFLFMYVDQCFGSRLFAESLPFFLLSLVSSFRRTWNEN